MEAMKNDQRKRGQLGLFAAVAFALVPIHAQPCRKVQTYVLGLRPSTTYTVTCGAQVDSLTSTPGGSLVVRSVRGRETVLKGRFNGK
jgi:hypothetical protein